MKKDKHKYTRICPLATVTQKPESKSSRPVLVPNEKNQDFCQLQVPLLPPFTASLTPVKQ